MKQKFPVSKLKVHIIEPLSSSLANPLQKLNNASFLLVHKGVLVDLGKSPKDLNIVEGAHLFVFGALSMRIENLTIAQQSFKFYMRFRETKDDGWYIGRDRWDAAMFIPRRDVLILGAGIYEPFPQSRRDFKYGHKYVI